MVSALRSSEDRAILHQCKTPKEAWTNLTKWDGPQAQGARTEYYRKMHSFEIAAGQNPLIALGEFKDMAAEMRGIDLAVDDPMLYPCFLEALSGGYEAKVRQLAGKTDLGREEIMRTIRERSAHVPKSQKDGARDHALFVGNAGGHASRVERNGRNGVGGGRGCGRGVKNYLPKSRKYDDSTSASGEENSKPLIGRTPIAGDVGRKDASDPCLNRRSAKDAKGPGTGLTFAHP